MSKTLLRIALATVALVPIAAHADPVRLKLAMFSADTEMTWVTTIKPWADAVNKAAPDAVKIDAYTNGALGRDMRQQAQMVLDGVADIAFLVPGITPGRFPDNEVMDLPGLFRTLREATLVYTRIAQQHLLRGFDDYYVVGAMATPPFEIDARAKITTLDDLKGKKIRVTNASQAATLKGLGAVPILLPPPEVPEAIGRGTIDGATEFPGVFYDFGIDRVTKYDYFLPVGVSSLTILMNKKKFDSLPIAAQDAIAKYSGTWVANTFIKQYGKYISDMRDKMKADPKRVVTQPSPQDLAAAAPVFKQVVDDWLKKDPHNSTLLQAVRAEIDKVRGGI